MFQPNRDYVLVTSFSYLPVAKIVDNPGIAKIALANGTLIPNPQSANQVGARSTGAAKYKASVWNRYRFSRGQLNKLGLGFGLAYVDEVRLSTDPTIAGTAPAYFVGRATIDYPVKIFNRTTDLSLIVTNLFDERYYRGIFRESPRTFTLRVSADL
jgi:outer membrane receptor protein involved in Fe transport